MLSTTINAQHISKINPSGEPTYNSAATEECYCNYYNDFYIYLGVVDALASAAQAEREAWYNNQKNVLKREIEDRMDKTYNSFEDAQFDFLKRRFADSYANMALGDLRNIDVAEKNSSYVQYSNTYVTRRIFQFAQNNSAYNFQGLTHNNRSIESMSYTEARNLWIQYNTDNGAFETDWEYHHNRILRNDWVKTQGQFHDFLTQEYINHINSRSLEDRVTLMTGYLTYNARGQSLVQPPPTIYAGIPFYLPYNYNYDNVINNYINNANVVWQRISSLNMSFDELKRRYSTTSMHLGNLVGNYLKDKDDLRDKVGTYQQREAFDYTSRNMVKKLVEHYMNDENFASDSYFDGTQSWGQNDDRPVQIANVRLSTAALNYGFQNFGGVMQAMSEFTSDYAKEGKMIKTMIRENTTFTFPNSLSDSEIGRVFDFDDRGAYYLGIKFSNAALQRIYEVEHGDNLYNWSLFTDPFKIQALEALANGGKVDFEDELIITNSVPQCVRDIIDQIVSRNVYIDLGDMPGFIVQELNLSGYIMDVFSNSSNYHLNFKVANLQPDSQGRLKNAETVPRRDTSTNYIYFDITLDASYVSNATDLAIARTIIHESLHAYISYRYQTQMFSELWQSMQHLLSQQGATANSAQHILMAQQFVDNIASSLEAWDQGSLNDSQYYKYISWSGGMLSTPSFNNLSQSDRQNVINANLSEGNAGPNGGYTSNAKGRKNCN